MAEKLKFNRRDFLKVIGAGAGVAAVGCAKDLPEKFIPYVVQPDEIVPGVATWYAGACNECSSGCGVLVKTREGRAIKIEGNSSHPINRGGLCTHGQAALQSLYNPDRVREPLKREVGGNFVPISWKEAIDILSDSLLGLKAAQAQGILLTKPSSGSESAIISEFSKKIPELKHYQYELFNTDSLDTAIAQLFGPELKASFDLAKAQVIVGFGADYLETWLSPVEFSKDWAEGRKGNSQGKGTKVIHFEPRLSLTAGNSDRWVMNKAGTESQILAALLKLLLEKIPHLAFKQVVADIDFSKQDFETATGVSLEVLGKVAEQLVAAQGKSLVLTGGASLSGKQALDADLLSTMINFLLGNIGTTVVLNKVEGPAPISTYQALVNLITDISQKKTKVGTLIISGTNPAFTLPKGVKFQEALSKVGLVVAISTHLDETATLANLVLPLSHQLESWSDAEPRPGVLNLNQPSMQPLYKTQSLGDTLISLAASSKIKQPFAEDVTSFYDYIRKQWKNKIGETDFEKRWLDYVEKGGDWSAYGKSRAGAVSLASSSEQAIKNLRSKKASGTLGVSLLAYPSVNSFDGSSANKPWMQELPNPITSAVWGSWIEINPELAEKVGVKTGDLLQVVKGEVFVEAPAYLTKRIDPSLVAIPIGQGHTAYGRYATAVGTNPLSISDPASLEYQSFLTPGVRLQKSMFKDELVLLQGSDTQMKRGIVRSVTVAELQKEKNNHHAEAKHGEAEHEDPLALGPREEPKMMYKQMEHPLYRWGMSIDLASCTGCSACVVACFAENNIPVVGKTICNEGREMSWLRIERYFDGPDEQPVDAFLPMMCQQCGNAPCEPVCPVYATYHTDEGLNSMVYNRCVGTRYCSNNCSYKVRRFNWFKYEWAEPLNWQLNPDVSMREVGTMEKCSFCIQRVREVQNKAKDLGRPVQDGEIKPACASSCPTGAIKFGNLLDKESLVAKDHLDVRTYKVLDAELNTQPAIAYLARVRNEI